jgi:hypothetical protein
MGSMARNVLIAYAVVVLFAPRIFADCGAPPSSCDAFATAGLVFYGEVLEAIYHSDYVGPNGVVSSTGHQDVRFNVLRAFKGAESGVFGGTFRMDSEAVRFTKGNRYLVFASQRDGQWFTSCSRTSEILPRIKLEEIEQLKELEACPKPLPIR